ncbi:hypothetical protein FQA47_011095 [Oryzias melastigma]|uniref:Uncharacterized protein n=1 Tax=Oryzias melastigma TaxID=30732 RepID=A0A834EZ73_ORYME|nr:hypothetical protein FQA47_011095 [Oryzias melastigma]
MVPTALVVIQMLSFWTLSPATEASQLQSCSPSCSFRSFIHEASPAEASVFQQRLHSFSPAASLQQQLYSFRIFSPVAPPAAAGASISRSFIHEAPPAEASVLQQKLHSFRSSSPAAPPVAEASEASSMKPLLQKLQSCSSSSFSPASGASQLQELQSRGWKRKITAK